MANPFSKRLATIMLMPCCSPSHHEYPGGVVCPPSLVPSRDFGRALGSVSHGVTAPGLSVASNSAARGALASS